MLRAGIGFESEKKKNLRLSLDLKEVDIIFFDRKAKRRTYGGLEDCGQTERASGGGKRQLTVCR